MKKLFIILAASMAFAGCKKGLLDTAPYTSVASETMWNTDNLTDLGVNGVYSQLRFGINTSSASGNELYQFDRFGFTGQTRDADALMNGTITPGNGLFSANWSNLYEGIHRANNAIKNIPLKSPSVETKKLRLIAECKFLRAYFYLRLNQLWKGVPIYLEPVTLDQLTKGRESEAAVWAQVITDLTDAINEPNLPDRYVKGAALYGHVTKGAAYALRGKAYMYTGEWAKAAADFAKVKTAGYGLFGDYKALFKQANEQCEEMIFSLQHVGVENYGSTTQFFCGTRSSFGSCWNTYLVSPNLVDLYENADGSKFNWDAVIPGYNAMDAAKREVYFLRNNLTATEITAMTNKGLNMSLYLPAGNEERIKLAYANRDPRLAANVITPYATYLGVLNGANSTVTSRWPYRSENTPTLDLRTDAQTYFYYLHRKFVYEGIAETPNRAYGPTDFPIIRYADVVLMWAEAINNQAFSQEAVDLVNLVRVRAGVAPLQTANAALPTYVGDQTSLTERIRDERRKEFPNEGINFFDEMRWKTWKEKVFYPGNGVKQIWGANVVSYSWKGDYIYNWAIPLSEAQMNTNLQQNDLWVN